MGTKGATDDGIMQSSYMGKTGGLGDVGGLENTSAQSRQRSMWNDQWRRFHEQGSMMVAGRCAKSTKSEKRKLPVMEAIKGERSQALCCYKERRSFE